MDPRDRRCAGARHDRRDADERFASAMRPTALRSIAGIPPFHVARELLRRVQADCAVEIDGNAYSVPWRLIGERVRATVTDGIGAHLPRRQRGRRSPSVARAHGSASVDPSATSLGLAGSQAEPIRGTSGRASSDGPMPSTLLRPLGEYEALLGGGF